MLWVINSSACQDIRAGVRGGFPQVFPSVVSQRPGWTGTWGPCLSLMCGAVRLHLCYRLVSAAVAEIRMRLRRYDPVHKGCDLVPICITHTDTRLLALIRKGILLNWAAGWDRGIDGIWYKQPNLCYALIKYKSPLFSPKISSSSCLLSPTASFELIISLCCASKTALIVHLCTTWKLNS